MPMGELAQLLAPPNLDSRDPPREFIDYRTSILTDEDPLLGLLFH